MFKQYQKYLIILTHTIRNSQKTAYIPNITFAGLHESQNIWIEVS